MRVKAALGLVILLAALSLATASSATATAGLEVLGSPPGERTVTFGEAADHSLVGKLAVAVRSDATQAAQLSAAYYPTGSTPGSGLGAVKIAGGGTSTLKPAAVGSVTLVFSLPAGATPADLHGMVVLGAAPGGKGAAASAQLEVTGAAPSLAGVTVRPEKLNVKIVDAAGPLGNPSRAYANVQLAGPGVPRLFGPGAQPLGFNLLLRSDHGDKARATLTDLVQGSEPALATATVRIEGDLGPGKFEGEAPISAFAAEAPKLGVTVESGDSVVYAVLVVFLGTMLGGALYLASNRRRRKVLLRDQVKSVLDLYVKRLDELETASGKEGLPIWSLEEYLGPQPDWYRIKWDSIVNFDGAVRTIWSEVHWARDDADLDQAAAQVALMRARVVRWLTVAKGVSVLQEAVRLTPQALANEPWQGLHVLKDSADLLQVVRQLEPPDDATAASLVDRIDRQAHWHTVFAEAWHAKAMLTRYMDRDDSYKPTEKAIVATIDLSKLDHEASPESGRKAERQIELEYDLARDREKIIELYRGEPGGLDLPGASLGGDDAHPADIVLVTTGAVFDPADGMLLAPALTEATRAEPADSFAAFATIVRGSSASDHAGGRIPVAIRSVLRRDLVWTIAIALATSAVYILTGVYTSSWGTVTDYVSAFAAGFIGKAAVSWAALPFFQSIRSAAASPAAPPPASPPAAPAGAAPPPAGAPAPVAPTPPVAPAPGAPVVPAPPAPAGDGAGA